MKSTQVFISIPENEYNKLNYLSQTGDIGICLLIKALLYNQLIQTSEQNLEDLVDKYQEYRMER